MRGFASTIMAAGFLGLGALVCVTGDEFLGWNGKDVWHYFTAGFAGVAFNMISHKILEEIATEEKKV